MGASSWSADHYDDRVRMRAATGAATFAYTDDISSGRAAAKVHDKLNPKGVVFRESRDSDAHPESVPVVVLCDVTGSMSSVPGIVQTNLKKLMSLLIRKGYVEHPQILVGAIGDATTDRAPIQIGQFESGIEIEDCLTNLYLEGGGGGHITESYELSMYFLARHSVHDHMEKRGEKGYLFIIGDEIPYDRISKTQVAEHIGDKLDQDLSTAEVLEELKEKYECFFILPKMTSNYNNPKVRDSWNKLLPQRVITLDNADGICECIAAQIGMYEGKIDSDKVEDDLIDSGASRLVASSVSRALVPVGAGAVAKGGRGTVQKLPDSGKGGTLGKF